MRSWPRSNGVFRQRYGQFCASRMARRVLEFFLHPKVSMPTTSVADIVFNCPRCRGPIMVEKGHIGESSECPHCFEAIVVPAAAAVNKDRFVEPPGLRRILQEV